MLNIILYIILIVSIPSLLIFLFKTEKSVNEFRKKELDYLDQILKKMR